MDKNDGLDDFSSGPLDGFDLDLVGLDCAQVYERDEFPVPWRCPFMPGCGATALKDCPLARQRAGILPAPSRRQ
jgi:hypothetical protein